MEVNLRDAQHAYNFYVASGNHNWSPKTKFLYHVKFNIRRGAAPNSIRFVNEIGKLARTVELPQFRATVETKQQYNRKKNIQTRIDYSEVRIVFHDDNAGATKTLMQEYYNYYFKDGVNTSSSAYGTRDSYKSTVSTYGLDNGKKDTFFESIEIYQLSRGDWVSYKLINPIITQWGHDSMDYSEGAGIMQNTISLLYEAVQYNQGGNNVLSNLPGYDKQSNSVSSLSTSLSSISPSSRVTVTNQPPLTPSFNNISTTPASASTVPVTLVDIIRDVSNRETIVTQVTPLFSNIEKSSDPIPTGLNTIESILSTFGSRPDLLDSFSQLAISAGKYNSGSELRAQQLSSLSPTIQTQVKQDLLSKINKGDISLISLATDIIRRAST